MKLREPHCTLVMVLYAPHASKIAFPPTETLPLLGLLLPIVHPTAVRGRIRLPRRHGFEAGHHPSGPSPTAHIRRAKPRGARRAADHAAAA